MVSAILLIRSALPAMTAIAFKPNGPAIPIAAKRAAIIYRLYFFAGKNWEREKRQNDAIRFSVSIGNELSIDYLFVCLFGRVYVIARRI